MKTIQYECRPGQLRSTIYEVIIFHNNDNWNVIQSVYGLHYDKDFEDYNKYQFFPVQREKWDAPADAPQNLRTLVATADVLVRAVPHTAEKDLFIAGFFEHADDFTSVKNDLIDFLKCVYEISNKNYYSFMAEQIRLGSSVLLEVIPKSKRQDVVELVENIKNGNIKYEYAGKEIDKLLDEEAQQQMSDNLVYQIIGGSYHFIRWDVQLLLKDFDYESGSYTPKFQMVIYKKPSREKGVSGKYDVFLKRNGELDERPLMFTTKQAKALYIWFLTQASQKFKKDQIDKNKLVDIYEEIYGVKDEMEKKLSKNLNSKNERVFDAFIKDTKPSINRTVLAALKGVYDHTKSAKDPETKKLSLRDAEKWYIIQFEDGEYFVDIPKDCVEIPDSLH